VSDELERVQKEAVVTYSEVLSGICVEELKKTPKNISHVKSVSAKLSPAKVIKFM
jgi:hypothetical protein